MAAAVHCFEAALAHSNDSRALPLANLVVAVTHPDVADAPRARALMAEVMLLDPDNPENIPCVSVVPAFVWRPLFNALQHCRTISNL